MSKRISKNTSDSKTGVDELIILCVACEKKSAFIIWHDSYSGYRGRCNLCKSDWAES